MKIKYVGERMWKFLQQSWRKRKRHIVLQNLIDACCMICSNNLDIMELKYEELKEAFLKEIYRAFQLKILTEKEAKQLMREIKSIQDGSDLKRKSCHIKKQLMRIRSRLKYPYVICINGMPIRESLVIMFLIFGLFYVCYH